MLVAIAMTTLAHGSARVFQEFGAVAMNLHWESFNDSAVALLAISSDYGLIRRSRRGLRLCLRAGRLRLSMWTARPHKEMDKADEGSDNQ